MSRPLPHWHVARRPASWQMTAEPATWAWGEVASLPPFILADGSGPAQQQTVVRVCYDAQALYVHFDCADADIWGTYTRRDEPIYDEEVVELFLAPGEAEPVHYDEFEISPNGVLFDVRVHNPTSQRADMAVDVAWDCPDIRWGAERNDEANHWSAFLVVPWAAVAPPGPLLDSDAEPPP